MYSTLDRGLTICDGAAFLCTLCPAGFDAAAGDGALCCVPALWRAQISAGTDGNVFTSKASLSAAGSTLSTATGEPPSRSGVAPW
jgi:hypothetical protein